MSQLYRLFCEGLQSRTVEEGLSSTLILTSTPLEDDGADDAGFVQDPPQVSKPPHNFSPELENEVLSEKESPNLSVQGQVGSASTESNEAAEVPDPNNVNKRPTTPKISLDKSQQLSLKVCSPKRIEGAVKDQKSNYNSPVPQRDGNVNVSPVDFVDRIIATKHRDKAVAQKQRCQSSSSDSMESEKAASLHRSRSRKRTPISDSSETDFEGADELIQEPATASLSSPIKSPHNELPVKRLKENSDACKSTSVESTINLVIENTISSVDSISTTRASTEIEPVSPSAARCRVFLKRNAASVISPGRNISTTNNRGSIQNCTSDQITLSKSNCQQQSEADCLRLAAVLKGVVAYVEVRSGHDNRSMGVRTQLRALGATVVEKMNKEVTHVIFNEGSSATLRQARKQGCHLVSVLWIDECIELTAVAPENKHPPLNMHLYEESQNIKKYRKMKSLQPDFEAGKGEERLNNYIKKYRSKVKKAPQSQDNEKSSDSSGEEEHQTDSGVNKQQRPVLSNKNIVLKELSVVLNKINTVGASGMSVSSDQRHKRRLMPLQQKDFLSQPLNDYDSEEDLRPENPYTCPSSSKQRTILPTRRVRKQVNTPRRSSCFVRSTPGSVQSQYRQRKTQPQMRTMVCTFMHRRDIDVVAAVIKQLGGWILEPTVSPKTTHVVCGDSKRTINLLKGIAYGCWILHQEWVMRSLEAGRWLDEEAFELHEFPAIKQCRIARETLGVNPDIFSSIESIYVSKDTTPPRSDLVDLLGLCGANIVNTARQAKLIVGPYQRRSSFTSVIFVKEQWVLDSIQENMLQPFRPYRQ
ncbi:uncharacterized protein LOC113203413 isoform X1 [Frankliniella occidentalis]|uniref:Uncharacterized protein LOC113203413 isoform X1 n=1 Tax=Frankliniella occidentalis TaxID=133901 RepID=A0A6J1RYM7_FRAOC|nr:uncharacterized protein LOC113203413 isoform X1 [Frankliniella occidentalis]